MRRRFSSLALAIVGGLAVRAAYWPTEAAGRHADCQHEHSSALADYGLHAPAVVVLVLAVLDLLASFAPAPCALPRAVAGRREPVWIPLASPARALIESEIADTLRSLGWLVGVGLAVVAYLAFVAGGPRSGLAFASHALLAVLVVLRLPPMSRDYRPS